MSDQFDDDVGTVTVETESDTEATPDPSEGPGVVAQAVPATPRWLRAVTAVGLAVTIAAAAVLGYGVFLHRTEQTAESHAAAAVTAARDWVNLFVTANDESVVTRADQIADGTTDSLHADAMNRIEPYLELLFDDGSGQPLRVTSAAVESDGARTGRPPLPAGATAVLVTTTARSGSLGHGYALWVYVVDDGGVPKIVDFGGAG